MKTNIRHKIFAVICVMALICSVIVFAANAAQPAPVFTVNGADSLRPGDEVTVTVSVNDNRGYCAGEFILGYDSDALTPVSISGGEAASEYFVGNENYADGKVYFAVIDEELMTDGGTLASVTFKVRENVVLYSGDLTLKVPTLVGNISVGYGFNNVKSTANGGELHAAKQIFVPDAIDPNVDEELSVKADGESYVVGASTYTNLTQAALAANFGTLTAEFSAADGTALTAAKLLTTGCRIKLIDSNTSNTLVMSVAGDVDGNYSKDANDAFLVGMFQNGLLDAEDTGTAYENAADLNGDGKVDQTDFDMAIDAAITK